MDLIAFFIGSDWFIEGDFPAQFPAASQKHQQFIVDTAGGIGSQPAAFGAVEGGDRFDQPDGADGNQVFRIFFYVLIFFNHMRYQAQVPFNQNVPGLPVTLLVFLKIASLFWCR